MPPPIPMSCCPTSGWCFCAVPNWPFRFLYEARVLPSPRSCLPSGLVFRWSVFRSFSSLMISSLLLFPSRDGVRRCFFLFGSMGTPTFFYLSVFFAASRRSMVVLFLSFPVRHFLILGVFRFHSLLFLSPSPHCRLIPSSLRFDLAPGAFPSPRLFFFPQPVHISFLTLSTLRRVFVIYLRCVTQPLPPVSLPPSGLTFHLRICARLRSVRSFPLLVK